MKVPGSEGSIKPPARSQDGRVGDVSVNRKGAPATSNAGVEGGLVAELGKSKVDTMKFSSLASSLAQELDPVRMQEERRAKIDSIRERIANRTYNPPPDAVAASTGEEISLEILFGGDALQDGDSR